MGVALNDQAFFGALARSTPAPRLTRGGTPKDSPGDPDNLEEIIC
jgi:hypothetical protein